MNKVTIIEWYSNLDRRDTKSRTTKACRTQGAKKMQENEKHTKRMKENYKKIKTNRAPKIN